MRKISKNIQNKKIITFNFYKRKTYLFYLKSRQMISYFVIQRILNIDPFDRYSALEILEISNLFPR